MCLTEIFSMNVSLIAQRPPESRCQPAVSGEVAADRRHGSSSLRIPVLDAEPFKCLGFRWRLGTFCRNFLSRCMLLSITWYCISALHVWSQLKEA